MQYRTLDPSTGELIETYPLAAEPEVDAALDLASRAFPDFRKRPFSDRAALLEAAATQLEAGASRLAETMALEMGKTLAEGQAEARKCAWVCRYYAEHGQAFLATRQAESDGSAAAVRYEPLGPILAIMPWNFPLWQVFRFAAPALAAGNVVILKHAPSTPRTAIAIADLLAEAGAPSGVLQNLRLSNDQAARVIEHPAIRGVTLTGSTRAGREVGAVAGRALKPLVLELGGSDPFIVFADAELDETVAVGVASRCLNNGQSCIAAKRFLVARALLEPFLERFVTAMQSKRVGDPRADGVAIGPLARSDLRAQLERQVGESLQQGAATLCGGRAPDGPGFFYPPTVLAGLQPSAPAAQEELFGPVATVYPFDDEAEAVAIANGTTYGLGASLWTNDPARILRLVPQLESGSVFVNGLVKSDPRLPFGGVKDSGFGRELGREGMLEFTNRKTVWIR